MKTLIILILCVIFGVNNLFSQCADTSNIYSFTYNGKNYEIVKELKNWTEAAACAVERGGYLVEINSQPEQNAIYDAIINGAAISTTYVVVGNGGGIAYLWTGATDRNTEGTWLWDGDNDGIGINFWNGQGAAGANNGSVVGGAYVNWGGTSTGIYKEPDNFGTGQNCAAIALAGWPSGSTNLGIPYEWNDIYESSQIYYVIEYDSVNTGSNEQINPNSEKQFFIKENKLYFFNSDFIEVALYDVTGKMVLRTKNTVSDISHLKNGFYIFFIKTQSKTYTDKLMILR